MSDWLIPLSDLDYGDEEAAAVLRVLRSKWLSMGPEVTSFESEFAAFQSAKHAFATSNATAALHLALLALDCGPDDEVIQPALNFVASANMTVAVGAKPVFADISSLHVPTIDPGEVERLITPKTKAVIVMHYGGHLCRMDELMEICSKHRLCLIEDACHAIGARYSSPSKTALNGIMAGSIGEVSAFSFFSNKNLPTGEGGMVVTQNERVAERVRLLRSHGMTTLTWDRHRGHASSYDVAVNGFNYRTDEIHAALGRVQLGKLSSNNDKRLRLIDCYRRRLKGSDWLVPFTEYPGKPSGHLMVALAPNSDTRQASLFRLREARIQTSLHYPCVPDFTAFAIPENVHIPLSREFTSKAVTLPLFPTMDEAQVDMVCQTLLGN